MIRATLNEATPLQMQANDGNIALYGRVKVYSLTGSLHTTLNLSHIANGLYGINYTFVTAGFYTAVYQFFTDPGYTVDAGYDIEAETIEVNSDKTNIIRLLGIGRENCVFDNQTYDNQGNLLTGRVRQYNSKANANAAGTTGLLNTWKITAAYVASGPAQNDPKLLINYKVTLE